MNQEQLRAFRARLRVVERQVARTLKEQTTCCGVTSAQCHLLMELGDAGAPSISGVAERLQLDASTLSRTVDGLVKAGLLDRVEDPDNRRSSLLSLTAAGRQVCAEIDRRCDDFYRRLLARVPAARHPALLEAMGLLAELFCDLPAAGCDAPSSPLRSGAPRRTS